MNVVALKEPISVENACRRMLENLFSSTRVSLVEFVASINRNTQKEETEVYEEIDCDKLNSIQQNEQKIKEDGNGLIDHKRSSLSIYLLERWLTR
jgi:hypothetical protein